MTGVQAIYVRRRLNPERPSVWFVGREDTGALAMIELERLPEGLPYLVPSWWTSVWGPFTKDEAQAIVQGRKVLVEISASSSTRRPSSASTRVGRSS